MGFHNKDEITARWIVLNGPDNEDVWITEKEWNKSDQNITQQESYQHPHDVSRYLFKINRNKLIAFFQKNKYPSRDDKIFLATKYNLSRRQISTWFANARRIIKHNLHQR